MRRSRGMTLLELMIVVVIIGVLSLLAVTAYQRHVFSARNAEAQEMLGGVRAAQEVYFQAFGQYCGRRDPSVWPVDVPFEATLEWGPPPEGNAWRDLGISPKGWVWFQYHISADTQGGDAKLFADPNRPWFWARAHGDFNGDNVMSTFEVTSQKAEVWSNNVNE